MVVHRIYKNRVGFYIPNFVAWIGTFVLMMFIWMFFYEPNMEIVGRNVDAVFSFASYDLAYFLKYLNGAVQRSACGLIFIGLSFVVILTEYLSRKRTGDPYRLFLSPYSCMVMIIAICMFRALHPSEFIYFAF